MSTITPVVPSVTPQTVTPIVPTAADVIPCAAFKQVILVITTGGTNTYAGVIDDPTSVGPANPTQFNPDVSTGTIPISSKRSIMLDTARFRDSSGNINLTSSSTFTGTTLEAYGVSP